MKTDLSKKAIQADCQALQSDTKLFTELCNSRQWVTAKAVEHQVGLRTVKSKKQLTFPVADSKGKVKYLKVRRLPGDNEQPKSWFYPRGNSGCLYPMNLFDLQSEQVVWVGGEPDVIAARSAGLNAATSTAGERTFDEKYAEYLKQGPSHKKFYCILDNDDTGRQATESVCQLISELCPEWDIFTVRWPADFPNKGDITDFLGQQKNKDAKDVLNLCKPFEPLTQQDLLLRELDAQSLIPVLPVQDFVRGIAYVTVILNRSGSEEQFTVTSEREVFSCSDKEYAQRGFRATRHPAGTSTARWAQSSVKAYLTAEQQVDLMQTYNRIEKTLRTYTDLQNDRYYSLVAVWIMGTYYYRLFSAYPYLHLTGMWGSGKTKFLEIISLLSFNGELFTSDSSPASIVRLVHANGSTCCIDEAEKLKNKSDDGSGVLAELLRIGYKRGVTVRKCEGQNTQFTVLELDPYSPKVLAGIANVDPALASRAIRIETQRTTNQKVANSVIQHEDTQWSELRSALYVAFLERASEIPGHISSVDLGSIIARSAELWRPLIVMANLIDENGELTNNLKELAAEMEAERKEEEKDTAIHLVLIAVYEMLGDKDERFISAEDMFDKLAEDDDFNWLNSFDGTKRRGKWLNKQLRLLGLWKGRAKLKSVGGAKLRGYDIQRIKIVEAARRYGVQLSTTNETPIGDMQPEQIQAVFSDSAPSVTND